VTNPYRVPKRVAEVTVRGTHGGERRVRLFVGDAAEEHAGAERPDDLFNGPAEFLPVQDPDGSISLLRRSAVALVLLADDDAKPLAPAGESPQPEQGCESVSIELVDGARLRGTVRFALPEGRRRLRDYLNLDPPFLPVRCGERVVLVNKSHIARVAIR